MKKIFLLCLFLIIITACKNESKITVPENTETIMDTKEKDTIFKAVIVKPIKKSVKQIKLELAKQGFETFDYVDKKTQDTILMQQYFVALLKKGPIRVQNEEETAELQKLHMEHLSKMHTLGFADISGPFESNDGLRGMTIYNVPTLKMADSLANTDPMVIAGHLTIEMHSWWAGKGFQLR